MNWNSWCCKKHNARSYIQYFFPYNGAMNAVNDRAFLREIFTSCWQKKIGVFVFGGWAEELWGVSEPRIHTDIDFLYPAADFSMLDTTIQGTEEWLEMLPKRFPHKRAISVRGIMVEFFLVQSDTDGPYTCFFDNLCIRWPADTFDYTTSLLGTEVNIASQSALEKYRNDHASVRRAYMEYTAERGI